MDERYRDRLAALSGVTDFEAPPVEHVHREEVRQRVEPVRTLVRWCAPFRPLLFQAELIQELASCRGRGAQLLVLPTGAGKTAVAASSVLQWLEHIHGSVLWLAPQRELVLQAHAAVGRLWESGCGPDSLELVLLPGGRDAVLGSRPRVLFATPQLLLSNGVLFEAIRAAGQIAVVIDEAHHFGADAFASVVRLLAEDGAGLLGLSATPRASSQATRDSLSSVFSLGLVMSRRLGTNPAAELQRMGVLAQVVHQDLAVPSAKRSGIFSSAARWKLKDLVSDPDRWRAIVEHICLHGEADRQVVCCLDRAHGIALTMALRRKGMDTAAYIDGEYSMCDRASILEAFHDGRVRTLVQVQLVMEGVDIPRADSLVLTHPITSEVEAAQAIGRVLRGPAVGGTKVSKVVSPDIDQTWVDEMLNLGDLPLSGWTVRWA
jgi:superfamily II DNA or RNA helicase